MRYASGFSVVALVALVALGAVLPGAHAAPPGLLDGQPYAGVFGPKERAGDRAEPSTLPVAASGRTSVASAASSQRLTPAPEQETP